MKEISRYILTSSSVSEQEREKIGLGLGLGLGLGRSSSVVGGVRGRGRPILGCGPDGDAAH